MSNVQMLRALVKQRLTAAAEEIFGLFERTIVEYEEELCRSKEENKRQRELLDSVFNPQLRLHRADVEQLLVVKEEVPPEQQEGSSSVDQEEPEPPPHIKEELWSSQEREQLQGLEEADITKFPFTLVHVKSEDDEEKAQSSQLHQRHTQHMKTEADREDCGGPEPPRNSHPPLQPETEDQTGDSSEHETDDSADWKETREPQSASNSLKHDSRSSPQTSEKKLLNAISGLSRQLTLLAADVNEQFTAVNSRLLSIEDRLDTLESKNCVEETNSKKRRRVHNPKIAEAVRRLHNSETNCRRYDPAQGLSSPHNEAVTSYLVGVMSASPDLHDADNDAFVWLHQRRTEHMETEADGEEPARNSQPHTLFHPETGDSVDSDFWKESRERLSGFNSLEDDGCNTDRKSFSCSECGKRFGKFWCLKRHMRIHLGENYSVSQPGERTAIKEDEPQPPPHIKEEEEELFPFTPVPVKSEDDEKKGHLGEKGEREDMQEIATGLPQRQTEHMETETDVSVDSDFWKETREPQSSLNSLKDEEVPVTEERHKTDKKSFGCSECGKRFGAVGDLNRHMRIHTGEKPFSCSVCCRRFLSSTHLKTHMLTHTGEKPFSCLFCDKRFRHSGNLTAHMNIHTGEKRFSCSVCDKTFTWWQQVKKHKCVQSSQLHQRQSEDKTADF